MTVSHWQLVAHRAQLAINLFDDAPSNLSDLASILEEIETNRGSIQLKYLWTKKILTGTTYDKGAQPYQDFDLLCRLAIQQLI
jgi:hypothetical protein